MPRQVVWFGWFALGLSLLFVKPLYAMVDYALNTQLHSHAILIPFVSAYLIWISRKEPLPRVVGSPALAVVPLVIALVALKAALFPGNEPATLPPNDYLALTTFGYLCLLWAGALLILGGRFFRQFLFPALFLIFLVPMPTVVEHGLEVFFQYTSAEASALLFSLSGVTYFRDGLVFKLPGISLEVAEECSGIRSSFVLFITSLLAGQMFLKSPQRRLVLALFVIPLGIVRNGFRILTIGLLCVHVGPHMIDSPIHHRGGPVFFALSLIPFFLFLFWLRRGELRKAKPATSTSVANRSAH